MISKKMKNGIIATYISYAIQAVIGIALTPVLIKTLGQSEYGVYQIAVSIASAIGILNFGIPHTYMRYYAIEKNNQNEKNIRKLNATYITTISCVSLFVILVGCTTAFFCGKVFCQALTDAEILLCRHAIILLSVNTALSLSAAAFETYFLVHEKFALNKFINCFQYLVTSLLSMVALLLGCNLYIIIVVTILITALKLVFVWRYSFTRLEMKVSNERFDTLVFKSMMTYSSFLFINLIIDQVNWNIDRVLLGTLVNAESAAIYSVGSQIHSMYMQLMIAISAVFITRINDLVAQKATREELTNLMTKVGRIQFVLAGIVNIGFLTYGKWFIQVWAGDGYENAYAITAMLMLSSTPLYIQNVATEIQRAKNLHKFRGGLYLVMCVLNITLSIIFIKEYNEIGAALGTAITLLVGDGIAINIYYKTKVDLDVTYFWKKMFKFLPAFLPTIVYGIIVKVAIKPISLTEVLTSIFIMCLIYLLSIVVLVLDNNEKQIIKKYLFVAKGNK